jgi:hypothetical protein
MKEQSSHITVFAALLTSLGLLSEVSTACGQDFTAMLRGAYEVPPINSSLIGNANFTLSNNVLCSAVYYPSFPEGDLHSAPCCTWPSVGIYGPAPIGANGPLVLELRDFYPVGDLSIAASCDELRDEEVEQLKAGLLYVNLVFREFPERNMRGQICPSTPEGDCDQDGVINKDDLCSGTTPSSVVDRCGCNIEQLLPCSAPWNDHKEYVKAFRVVAMRFWKEGSITVAQRNALIKQAEESNCGE